MDQDDGQTDAALESTESARTQMPGLYSLLTAPESSNSYASLESPEFPDSASRPPKNHGRLRTPGSRTMPGVSDSEEDEDIAETSQTSALDDLDWSGPSTSKRQFHELSAETTRNTCKEKRSRGYIARILAAKQKSSDGARLPGQSPVGSSEPEEPTRARNGASKTSPDRDSPPSATERSFDTKFGINMRKWRVKTVVEDHVQMMRALSGSTLSAIKMPGDLKHMDLKPRLLGSDRTAILGHQDEMKKLLQSEFEILQEIRRHARAAVSSPEIDEHLVAAEMLSSYQRIVVSAK